MIKKHIAGTGSVFPTQTTITVNSIPVSFPTGSAEVNPDLKPGITTKQLVKIIKNLNPLEVENPKPQIGHLSINELTKVLRGLSAQVDYEVMIKVIPTSTNPDDPAVIIIVPQNPVQLQIGDQYALTTDPTQEVELEQGVHHINIHTHPVRQKSMLPLLIEATIAQIMSKYANASADRQAKELATALVSRILASLATNFTPSFKDLIIASYQQDESPHTTVISGIVSPAGLILYQPTKSTDTQTLESKFKPLSTTGELELFHAVKPLDEIGQWPTDVQDAMIKEITSYILSTHQIDPNDVLGIMLKHIKQSNLKQNQLVHIFRSIVNAYAPDTIRLHTDIKKPLKVKAFPKKIHVEFKPFEHRLTTTQQQTPPTNALAFIAATLLIPIAILLHYFFANEGST